LIMVLQSNESFRRPTNEPLLRCLRRYGSSQTDNGCVPARAPPLERQLALQLPLDRRPLQVSKPNHKWLDSPGRAPKTAAEPRRSATKVSRLGCRIGYSSFGFGRSQMGKKPLAHIEPRGAKPKK
jgi:hypothetical protein